MTVDVIISLNYEGKCMILVPVFLDLEEMPDNHDNLFVYLSKDQVFKSSP